MRENMREYAGKNQMGSDHGGPNRHFEGLSLLFVHTKLPSFRLSIRCDLAMGKLLAWRLHERSTALKPSTRGKLLAWRLYAHSSVLKAHWHFTKGY